MCYACNSETELETLSAKRLQALAMSDSTSIIETKECTLTDGKNAYLPWTNSANGTIPEEIRKDVKETDGWKILYSTVKILGYDHQVSKTGGGANYILFYNRYSGVLKGFYYATDMKKNNTALWHIIFDKNSKLANFASYFALANDNSTPSLTLSNVSTNGVTNGFDYGWNCFMQELAYDENSMNQNIAISGYVIDKAAFTFTGSFQGESKGTIFSTVQQSPNKILTGITQQFGEEAKQWIQSKLNTGGNVGNPIKSNSIASHISDILFGGVSSLLTSGLQSIFGSLLGIGTTTKTNHLQFTSNGKVKITGESIQPASGIIWPISGVPLNGIGENLGVWNLKETPKYNIDQIAELKLIETPVGGNGLSEYVVKAYPQYTFIKNPACTWYISPDMEIVEYGWYYGENVQINPSYNDAIRQTAFIKKGQILYDDPSNVIYSANNTYEVILHYEIPYGQTGVGYVMPNKKTASEKPAFDLMGSHFPIRRNVAIKINTTIYPGGDKRVVSSKTFIPKQEYIYTSGHRPYFWTLDELSRKGYIGR